MPQHTMIQPYIMLDFLRTAAVVGELLVLWDTVEWGLLLAEGRVAVSRNRKLPAVVGSACTPGEACVLAGLVGEGEGLPELFMRLAARAILPEVLVAVT